MNNSTNQLFYKIYQLQISTF